MMRGLLILALAVITASCANMVSMTVHDFPVPVYPGDIDPLEPGEQVSIRYKAMAKTPIEVHMISDLTALGDRYVYDVLIDGIMAVQESGTSVHTGVTLNSIKGILNGTLQNHAEMKLAYVSEYDLDGNHIRDLKSGLTEYRVLRGDGFSFRERNESSVLFPNLKQNVTDGGILAHFNQAPAFNQQNSVSSADCRLAGRVVLAGHKGLLCSIAGEIRSYGQSGTVQGYIVFDEADGGILKAAYTIRGPGTKIPRSLYSQKITFKRKT